MISVRSTNGSARRAARTFVVRPLAHHQIARPLVGQPWRRPTGGRSRGLPRRPALACQRRVVPTDIGEEECHRARRAPATAADPATPTVSPPLWSRWRLALLAVCGRAGPRWVHPSVNRVSVPHGIGQSVIRREPRGSGVELRPCGGRRWSVLLQLREPRLRTVTGNRVTRR
jgi:hypothetical protein